MVGRWWPERAALIGGTGALALVLASCTLPGTQTTSGAAAHGSPGAAVAAVAAPHLTLTPSDRSRGVALDAPVVVTADSGHITAVSVQEAGVAPAPAGLLSADSRTWQLATGLDSDATYTIQATASNGAGQSVSAHVTFSTLTAQGRLRTNVTPWSGETVGVGEPIDLTFNTSIPDDRKAALVQRIQVTSTPGIVGAWHWFSSNTVHFRPESYWPSGTKVQVNANLKGFDAGNGVWGLGDWSSSFTVGAKHVSVIDDSTHMMQVFSNDKLIDTWPVSLGKPGFRTLSGTLVVLYKSYVVKMNSCATFHTSAACVPGGSQFYDENVYYDTAISTNGFFIHAAPWSVYAQGHYDVSHGCVNLSTARAITFYNWSLVGDVVVVKHTTNIADITNGEADWQIPFSSFANSPGGSAEVSTGSTPAASGHIS